MRTQFLLSACAALALTATGANAQLLGGSLGGAGNLGGLSGGLGGAVDGSLSRTRTLPRAERVTTPRAAASTAASATALRNTASATTAVDGTSRQFNSSGAVVLTTPRAPSVAVPQVALPGVRTGFIGSDVAVVGRRRALIDDGIVFVPHDQVSGYIDQQVVVLDRELAGTGVEVERRGKQIFIEMPSDVTFAFDKANIQPRFYSVLSAVGRTLNRYPATYVDVVGHTDAVGSDAYNQALSQRRASSVAEFLVRQRAEPDRLYVEGRGESEPLASNTSVTGRAANRRVEIILTPHEA